MTEVAAKSTQSRLTSLRLPVLRSVVMHYGIAILAIALALALRLALASILAGEASYLFFLPAILIASALGGLGPGLFATVLGLLLGLFFVLDFRVLSPADIISAAAFTLVGAAMVPTSFDHLVGAQQERLRDRQA